MLEISALAKNFGPNPVLKDINLTVADGMLTAILGASGSGKTTLLRLIAGFLQPDAGEIRLDGRVLANTTEMLRPEQRGIGYVAQEGALFPHLTVGQNISFGLKRAERQDVGRIERLLAMVGLPRDFQARPPQALSGGEQQRVALARALAPAPKLLLLDEPFSALDAGLRADTRAAVATALKAANATAILVTHDQGEALSMGQMVGVMQKGQLVQWASPGCLYGQPVSADVARFVGEAVFVPAQAVGLYADCALGRLALRGPLVHGPVNLMIRPEQIKLENAASDVRARVIKTNYYGHDAVVSLQLCQSDMPGLMARVPGYDLPQPGDELSITVSGSVIAYPAA